ncbi:Rieske (2Fe-2S) protein [Pimelobacter simplex]|uniref:Rieske (2Fe-2S) protein n=1 Tax=Nocardioides simplex TaxID=2045 RepID=UPI00381C47CF
MTSSLSRRRALSGAATLGVGVPLLAACGSGDDGAAKDPASDPATDAPSTPSSPTATETASGTPSSGGGGAGGLVATADVPVGGGVIIKDAELVVTQPSAGEFKAFSAICTHQGCLVGSVSDGQIHCPCHGSSFSVSDGASQGGPAQTPLPEVAVTVSGGEVTRA